MIYKQTEMTYKYTDGTVYINYNYNVNGKITRAHIYRYRDGTRKCYIEQYR